MKFLGYLIVLVLGVQTIAAQQITCSPADRQAIADKTIEVDGLLEREFGKTIVAIGKTFLGTPYVAKTLEIGETETLVINLQGLDCTTYVENVLAFSRLLRNGEAGFDEFTEALEHIRYKDGWRKRYDFAIMVRSCVLEGGYTLCALPPFHVNPQRDCNYSFEEKM